MKMPDMKGYRIILITGAVNSGKTSGLAQWTKHLKSGGVGVAGVLAHAVFNEEGLKCGYDAEDVSTGERRILARMDSLPGDVTMGRFRFSTEGMQFARRAVEAICNAATIGVVDEIGPLELSGGGLHTAVKKVLAAPPEHLVLVVRKTLIEDVSRYYNLTDFLVWPEGNWCAR
ncbi:MAG TPA: nucleoside-triphosphatase [Candidatus Sumerlaeota bacterium]|nr:nucleoside-triphosphatase [Candidatus Sumerlaeota bacterium]